MRTFRSFTIAIACLALMAGPIDAQAPVGGAVRYYAPDTPLSFRLSGSFPTSIRTAVQTAAVDFSSPAWNNSRTPTFSYGAGGTGTVTYSASATSPCGTGNRQWLQCASNWGSTDFRIFVRDLSGAPMSNWSWCEIALVGGCFSAERALLHEMEHVVMGVGNHDPQGNANTIMGAIAPAYPQATWNTHHIQRCDESAAQLLYGVATPYGQFADCFGDGLIPEWSGYQTFNNTACLSQPVVLSGRIAIARDSSLYRALADTPLAGRTVWFDRKPLISSVWTLNVASTTASSAAGANWTRAFSTSSSKPISYVFRVHTDAETGVDASPALLLSASWQACQG